MGFKVEIKGLDAAIKGAEKTAAKFKTDLGIVIDDFGAAVETDAKRNAPADEGLLRNSIGYEKNGIGINIVATANYAAYVEFGTRKFAAQYVATLPQDWQTYAASFKGKGGGSFDEFLKSIMDWAKRKLIGQTFNVKTRRRDKVGKQSAQTTLEADAYGIALFIIRNGIRAQPFLYPAINKNKGKLESDIKKLVNG